MHNDREPYDRIRAAHGHLFILPSQMRFPGGVRFEITEVTGVMFGRIRGTMRFVRWVEMPAGGSRIRSRAVAEFMDMKPMFAGSESRDIGDDLHRVAGFREGYRARDITARSGVKDRDRFRRLLGEDAGSSNGDHGDGEETDERKNFDKVRFHDARYIRVTLDVNRACSHGALPPCPIPTPRQSG
jgi:hypothetical protein